MGNLVARLECIDPTGDTLGLWDDDVKALPSNIRPETPVFPDTPTKPHNPLNVRFGSKADIQRPPSRCPLSGAKQT